MRRALSLSLAVLTIALFALTTLGCEGRPRRGDGPLGPLSGPAIIEIDLRKGAPELVGASLFGPAPARTHGDLVQTLLDLDEEAKGVLVRLGFAGFGVARAEEVGRLLAEVRARDIPVVCHAHEYNNTSYLLASRACSEVWVSAAGSVDTVGIAAQLIFGKSLLDKLDVQADFIQIGKYKGAKEPFTRDSSSPEARKSLEGTLRGIRKAWLDAIAEGRGADLESRVEDGPWTAERAKELGLVDRIGDESEAMDALKESSGIEHVVKGFGGAASEPDGGLLEVLRAISGASEGGAPHVAVVRSVGAITMSPSGSLLGGSDGITEKELGKTLERLAEDEMVEAVVLRLDSPGGSALASDLLWKRLMRLREEKTLVVSVGGMAASGGYYLACAADKIVAERDSIVGSIGVVGGKFAVGAALGQVGVNVETVAASPDEEAGRRATYLSPFEPWDDATKDKVEASMQGIYDLFLSRIAEGRGMPVEQVATFAEGRIFAGSEAKDRGMIDELGGLADAVGIARELAELPDDSPVRLLGDQGGLSELFEMEEPSAGEAFAERARRAVDPLRTLLRELPPEAVVLARSLGPLAADERIVAALPIAIAVE